jgi:hypothetical protein
VRVDGLKPLTTYDYQVTSVGSDGVSNGVWSLIKRFTTSGPGKEITASSQRQ